MDKFVIEGERPLKGEVNISGAKNSVLPILAATLLTDSECLIRNAPISLKDTQIMIRLLRSLGKIVDIEADKIYVRSSGKENFIADYKLVSTMRASFCVLGPLLAKLKKAEVSLPGGCIIGVRPVDLHLKGLESLGAKIKIEEGYVKAKTKRLTGCSIYLGGSFGSSVLATANVMMAATLAEDKTRLESSACEPEITDLAKFLNKMGAKVSGFGTPLIEIEGVSHLKGAEHTIISDRIEVGTFIVASAITKGDIRIKGANPLHLGAVIDKLKEGGLAIGEEDSDLTVKFQRDLEPINITTLPYPGFPTDMQAQMMALMAVTEGVSVITERVYPDRFMHVAELHRMGAKIQRAGPHAIVEGVKDLFSAQVMASDLRASASLVLAGLRAKGKTRVHRIYHLDRGYQNLEKKLERLGARIKRVKE